jgi:hypothetical protein
MRSWRKVLRASTIGGSQFGLPFATAENFRHALWLLRLSYLRHALKSESNPRNLLEQENERLHLNPRFTSLLEPFVHKPATRTSTKPVSR